MLRDALVFVIAVAFVGCATEDGAKSTVTTAPACASDVQVQVPAVVKATLPKVLGFVGVVRCEQSEIVLNMCGCDVVSTSSRKLVLCAIENGVAVRICKASIVHENDGKGILRLDVRNVPDEDGDLIVMADERLISEFRLNPVKYISEHEVVAVVAKACNLKRKGNLK